MKLWVSNLLWALHWFGSPSNWLRSTPQSLPEAIITHCHAADCIQGFPSSVCKYTARISIEMRPQGAELQNCFSTLPFCFEFLRQFKDICPVLSYYTQHKACVSHCPFRLTTVLSALCIKLPDHEFFPETNGTNYFSLLCEWDWHVNIFWLLSASY